MNPGDSIGPYEVVNVRRDGSLTVVEVRGPNSEAGRIVLGAPPALADLLAADPDAALGPVERIATPDGPGILLASPLHDLSRLRGPYAPATVAAIGRHLAPALLAAAPGLPPGAPGAGDLGLDPAGRPVLTPAAAASPRLPQAPELADGRPNTPEASLFALGALLHLWAVGSPPIDGAIAPMAGALRPALTSLMHPDPSLRRQGLRALDAIAGPLPDLRLLLAVDPAERASAAQPVARSAPPASTSSVGEIVLTTSGGQAPARARRDDTDRTFAVVSPARASDLSPADRSALAGELGVPLGSLDDLIAQGRPIPLHDGGSKRAAREVAEASRFSDGIVGPGGGWLTAAGGASALFGLLLGGLGALFGLGFLATVGPTGLLALLPLAVGLVAVVLIAAGAAAIVSGQRASSAHRTTRQAAVDLERERLALEPTAIGAARRAAIQARRALARASLPEPAERDLRASIDSLEELIEPADAASATEIERGLTTLVTTIEALASQESPEVGLEVERALGQAGRAVGALTGQSVSPDDLRKRAAARTAAKAHP